MGYKKIWISKFITPTFVEANNFLKTNETFLNDAKGGKCTNLIPNQFFHLQYFTNINVVRFHGSFYDTHMLVNDNYICTHPLFYKHNSKLHPPT
jgi:hypothetical protein